MEKFNINRYGDVFTIDVERKYATELADFLDERNVSISEVRLQHKTGLGKIITEPIENHVNDRILSLCVFFFKTYIYTKMERPIGDKFTYDTVELEVVQNIACNGCFFLHPTKGCHDSLPYRGLCYNRNDGDWVIFRMVEK